MVNPLRMGAQKQIPDDGEVSDGAVARVGRAPHRGFSDQFERSLGVADGPRGRRRVDPVLARIERFARMSSAGARGVDQEEGQAIISDLLWKSRGAQGPSRLYEAVSNTLRLALGDCDDAGRGMHGWVLAVLHETRGKRIDDVRRTSAIGLLDVTLTVVDDVLAEPLTSHRLRLTWLRASLQRRRLYHQHQLAQATPRW